MTNPKRGGYYSPQPVDFVLLGMLPDAGMIGGIHWRGRRAVDLRQEILDSGVEAALVPTTFVSSRLRSMRVAGLVETYSAGSPITSATTNSRHRSSQIWARTEKGKEQLAKRDEILGGAA